MRKKRKHRAKAASANEVADEVAEEEGNADAVANDEVGDAASKAGADADSVSLKGEGEGEGGVEPPEAGDSAESDKPAVPEGEELKRVLESLLFVSEGPLTVNRMRQLTRVSSNQIVRDALEELLSEYSERGIVLYKVSGGYQFRSNAASSHWVQKLVVGRPVRLSRAQLETLAIIAYRQPITRPEIDEIRGVDSASTLRLLLERELIRVLGKKEEPGRPLLYGSTPEFLEFFNLNELRDLPTLREYSELTDESIAVVADKLGEEAAEAVGEGEAIFNEDGSAARGAGDEQALEGSDAAPNDASPVVPLESAGQSAGDETVNENEDDELSVA